MSRAQLLLCLLGITVGFFLNDAEARSARRLPTEGIVGGDYAHKNQFPYQVSLQAYDDSFCGGSILSKRYVITAAHCVVENNNSFTDDPIKVVAGMNNLNSKSIKIAIDVVKIFVPKEYNPTVLKADEIPIGDIAILKLNENFPIGGNSQLGIVKLPKKDETYEGKKAIISGYGLNEIEVVTDPKTGENVEVNGKSFYKLRYAKANVLSYKACQRIFSPKQVEKSHICAHLVQRRRKHAEGVCSGDSGGPLVYDGVQIGVLSISPFGCREDIESALYTRVSSYLGFINKAINDQADVNIRTKTLEILDY